MLTAKAMLRQLAAPCAAFSLVFALSPAAASAQSAAPQAQAVADETPETIEYVYAVIATNLGDITVQLNEAAAPISVANFRKYAEGGHYDGTIFHRALNVTTQSGRSFAIVQGGGYLSDFTEIEKFGGITNEWQNGLKNTKGTIAMARIDGRPSSATSEFYFNVTDNTSFDIPQGDRAAYAVFGKVISGFEIVEEISKVEVKQVALDSLTKPLEAVPVNEVVMETVRIVEPADIADTIEAYNAEVRAEEEAAAQARRAKLQQAISMLSDTQGIDPDAGEFAFNDLWQLVVTEGEGESPSSSENALLYYKLWLSDGTVIGDSRDASPLPVPIPLATSPAGFVQAVTSMKPGGKRYVVIPSELGLGDAERPGIPGGSVLVFEIELSSQEQVDAMQAELTTEQNANAQVFAIEELGMDIDAADITENGVIRVFTGESEGAPELDASTFVNITYQSWLADGTAIDVSALVHDHAPGEHNHDAEPVNVMLTEATFTKGFIEGIEGIGLGQTVTMIVPSDQAFGDRGTQTVPPMSAMIYQATLHSTKTQMEAASEFLVATFGIDPAEGETFDNGVIVYTTGEPTSEDAQAAKEGDEVKMHVARRFADGTESGSTFGREPQAFPLEPNSPLGDEVIKHVVGLKAGQTRHVILPWDIAFDGRAPRGVAEGSILLWQIEVHDVTTPVKPDATDQFEAAWTFLEENYELSREDAVTFDSGLAIITTGEAIEGEPAAKLGDSITVHYTGWLSDGTKFDSSVDRGKPATFPLRVGGLIKGWTDGIPGMFPGQTRYLVIPYDLGYGARGSGQIIGPYQTLVFKVDLQPADD